MRTLLIALVVLTTVLAAQQPNPRQQPGAITAFAPEQHDLYDGRFILSANRIYMVGTLNDPPGWDHMDNAAATLRPAAGTAEIDVDELTAGRELVVGIDVFGADGACAGTANCAAAVLPGRSAAATCMVDESCGPDGG